MPTGPKHVKFYTRDGQLYGEDCRCLIGEDHDQSGEVESQTLSVYAAADIWLSNGMDEDYTFGYSEDELRRAADE